MRSITFVLILLISTKMTAQNSEEMAVKQTIVKFFEAFHKQDSLAIKTVVSKDIILQSIIKNKAGVTEHKKENFSVFLKSIVSIPKNQKFEEQLLDFKIRVDGDMANAWTPYEFWFDGAFSHCGVNSFQLIKMEETWKIIYLIDTRRREGCNQ